MILLEDIVICRYSGHSTRLMRKAIRRVAHKQGVAEWIVVNKAIRHYGPVMEMVKEIKEGERNGIG